VSRLLVLSHPLRPDSPVWPGNPPAAAVELVNAIARGDTNNAAALHLFAHSGTHADTPWHFNPAGRRAAELPIEAFVFDAPRLVDVPAGEREPIDRRALERHADTIAGADLVMIRTGWSVLRATEPARYATEGPYLAADAARWLIDEHPRLRAIATDAISIGSPHHRDIARDAHHALTGVGRTDDRFVLIYEDVGLVPEAAAATRVFAWPLFVEGADGSPVTFVAELPDRNGAVSAGSRRACSRRPGRPG
jgi:arylformamidase